MQLVPRYATGSNVGKGTAKSIFVEGLGGNHGQGEGFFLYNPHHART